MTITVTLSLAVVSVLALVGLVIYFRERSRSELLGQREDVSLERLRTRSKMDVPPLLFEEVFSVIGKELGIRPGQLRPSDKLEQIFKVDSWQLGGAQDALEDLIRKKTTNRPPAIITIQDLLYWLAEEQRRQSATEGLQ